MKGTNIIEERFREIRNDDSDHAYDLSEQVRLLQRLLAEERLAHARTLVELESLKTIPVRKAS